MQERPSRRQGAFSRRPRDSASLQYSAPKNQNSASRPPRRSAPAPPLRAQEDTARQALSWPACHRTRQPLRAHPPPPCTARAAPLAPPVTVLLQERAFLRFFVPDLEMSQYPQERTASRRRRLPSTESSQDDRPPGAATSLLPLPRRRVFAGTGREGQVLSMRCEYPKVDRPRGASRRGRAGSIGRGIPRAASALLSTRFRSP